MRVAGKVVDYAHPIYDSAQIATSGTTSLDFFRTPKGGPSTVWAASGNKTQADTNMELSGQLPKGWSLKVRAFSLVLWPLINVSPITQAADMVIALGGAVIRFNNNGFDWLFMPAKKLTGGCGIEGFWATTATTVDRGAAHNGIGDPRAVFGVGGPLQLEIDDNETFFAQLTWPSGTGPTITAALNAQFFLEGILTRPAV